MPQLFYFFNALEINCIIIPCTRNEVARDILVLMFLNGPSVSQSVSPVCSTLFRCADYQDIPITLFFGEFSEI